VLLWLVGVFVCCGDVVGNMECTLVGGGGYGGFSMSGGIFGIAGIGGIGKNPLNGGWRLNGCGCM
jgi:hypothetical protein